jgi:hypothetical protein
VRLHLEEPVAGACGDRGLIRRYSPQDLIGGITLLWPGGANHKRDERLQRLYEALGQNDLNEALLELLRLTRQPPTRADWAAKAGYLNERDVQTAQQQLVGSGRVLQAGQYYVAAEQVCIWRSSCRNCCGVFIGTSRPSRDCPARFCGNGSACLPISPTGS